MMASSIILRNENGEIKGYAIVQKGSLLVMVKGNGESGKLVLISDNGKRMEFAVVCNNRETTIPYNVTKLTDGWLLTGTAVKEEELEQEYSSAMKNDESPCKNKVSDFVCKEVKKTELVSKEKQRMNRWPPPPCWPTAHYVDGVWCEGDERTPECI